MKFDRRLEVVLVVFKSEANTRRCLMEACASGVSHHQCLQGTYMNNPSVPDPFFSWLGLPPAPSGGHVKAFFFFFNFCLFFEVRYKFVLHFIGRLADL